MTKLKLDYDDITFQDVELIYAHRGWLLKRLGLVSLEVAKSRNGYHVEAIVEKELIPEDVILVQILLGSDIHREIYNLLHHLDGELVEQWNKLFDKKYVILGTRVKEIGGEVPSPGLTERLKNIVNIPVPKKKDGWEGYRANASATLQPSGRSGIVRKRGS